MSAGGLNATLYCYLQVPFDTDKVTNYPGFMTEGGQKMITNIYKKGIRGLVMNLWNRSHFLHL